MMVSPCGSNRKTGIRMFIVQLTFKDRSALAANREAHAAWLREQSAAVMAVAAGTIVPPGGTDVPAGGMVMMAGDDRSALDAKMARAPLITSGAASAEVIELRLSFADERLAFLNPGGRPVSK